jgi:hypothetical protein
VREQLLAVRDQRLDEDRAELDLAPGHGPGRPVRGEPARPRQSAPGRRVVRASGGAYAIADRERERSDVLRNRGGASVPRGRARSRAPRRSPAPCPRAPPPRAACLHRGAHGFRRRLAATPHRGRHAARSLPAESARRASPAHHDGSEGIRTKMADCPPADGRSLRAHCKPRDQSGRAEGVRGPASGWITPSWSKGVI